VPIGGGIIGSPVVVGDSVFFAADNGLLIALNARTGREQWRFQQEGATIVFSPAVDGETVYVPVSNGVLFALNAQTGTEAWRYDPTTTTDIYSAAGDVVVDGGRVYFMTVNVNNLGVLHAIDQATHELVWRIPIPAEVFSAPTAGGELLIWGALDGVVYAINAETGESAWTFETGDAIFTAAAIAGDQVYVGSVDKNLYALDVRTGAQKWQFRAESPVSSPAIKDGVIYVGTEAGTLFAIQ
jgi:outer membrane protein assembly factor BamB